MYTGLDLDGPLLIVASIQDEMSSPLGLNRVDPGEERRITTKRPPSANAIQYKCFAEL